MAKIMPVLNTMGQTQVIHRTLISYTIDMNKHIHNTIYFSICEAAIQVRGVLTDFYEELYFSLKMVMPST